MVKASPGLTAVRLWPELGERDYASGYTAVKRAVRDIRQASDADLDLALSEQPSLQFGQRDVGLGRNACTNGIIVRRQLRFRTAAGSAAEVALALCNTRLMDEFVTCATTRKFLKLVIGFDATANHDAELDCIALSKPVTFDAAKTGHDILALVHESDGKVEHITRLTWLVIDKKEYLSRLNELGQAYRSVMGKDFPAMTLVQVVALVEDAAEVEIEATAVVPD